MCEICDILKDESKRLLDTDKWAVFKSGLVVWKKHAGIVDCDTCLMWIQLKCRELFGEDCRYSYDIPKLREHFHFYVKQ
jgi:hypothetical protein